jgi:hypothetical protein
MNRLHLDIVTKAQKLFGYICAVTEKSPKCFRIVFVKRLQNYALEIIENILSANLTKLDSENLPTRKKKQENAVIKLKTLSLISLTAKEQGCINDKQYEQIAKKAEEICAGIIAWERSDGERVKAV